MAWGIVGVIGGIVLTFGILRFTGVYPFNAPTQDSPPPLKQEAVSPAGAPDANEGPASETLSPTSGEPTPPARRPRSSLRQRTPNRPLAPRARPRRLAEPFPLGGEPNRHRAR